MRTPLLPHLCLASDGLWFSAVRYVLTIVKPAFFVKTGIFDSSIKTALYRYFSWGWEILYGYKSNFSFFSRIWEEGPCKPLRNFFRLFSLTRFSIFILSCAHFINVSGATWSSLAASIIVHSPLIYRSYALLNPSGVIPFVISFSSLNSDSSLASKNTNIN